MAPPALYRLAGWLGLRSVPDWVGDALLAIFFAVTWTDPLWAGETVPGDLRALYIFEGLAIHATPFWIVARQGLIPKWVLLIYVPFVVGAGVALDSTWLMALFLWHLASLAWREEETEAGMTLQFARYVVVVLLFLLIPFALWLFPVPELGWRPDVVSSELAWEKGSGALVYAALPAFGTAYFALRAAWHVTWWHWERTGQLVVVPPEGRSPPARA